MVDRATGLRPNPSITKLIGDHEPLSHVGQFAGHQYERPFMRMMHGIAIFSEIKRFKSRVAHTNPWD